MYERFLAEAEPYEANVELWERVEREGSLMLQIAPLRWRKVGPAVYVHRVQLGGV